MDSKDYKINALTQQISTLYQRQEFDEASKSISLLCEISPGSFECQYARFYDTIIREISQSYFGPQAKHSVVRNYLGRLPQNISSLYATLNIDTIYQRLDLYTRSFFAANKFISDANVRVSLFEAIQSAKSEESKVKIVNLIINISRDLYALPTVLENIDVVTEFTKLLAELLSRSTLGKAPHLENIGSVLLEQLNKMMEFSMSINLLNNYLVVYEGIYQLTSKKIKYPDVEKLRAEYDSAREEEKNFKVLEREYIEVKAYYNNSLLNLDKVGEYEIHSKRLNKLYGFLKTFSELSPKIKNLDITEINKAQEAITKSLPSLEEKVKKVTRILSAKRKKRLKRTVLVITLIIFTTISIAVYDHFRMNVSFDLQQGQWETDPPSTRYFSIENLVALEPTREGYTFEGWYLNQSLTREANQENINRREDVSLYAKWEILEYQISFNSNGGNSIASRDVNFGSPIQNQPQPFRTGYSFEGWYLDSNLTQVFNLRNMPSENIELYAKWSVLRYQITFYNEERTSVIRRETYDFDSLVTIPNAPQKEGFTFNRFNRCLSTSPIISGYKMPNQNIDACASYSRNNYTLTFQNGTQATTRTVPFQQTVSLINPPARSGFVFRGWYETSTFSRIYVQGPMPARNLTLYAKWSQIFDLTIELNGGVGTSRYQIPHENNLNLQTPTKEGFFFGGFYLDEALENPLEFDTMPARDVKLYVNWLPIRTLTFSGSIPDLIVVQTFDFAPSIAIEDVPIPVLEHFEFGGFYLNFFMTIPVAPGTVFDRNATLIVRWIPVEYTLEFETNGGNVIAPVDVSYKSLISTSLPQTPTRDGYVFAGWYTNQALTNAYSNNMTMPGNDLVLYANWERDPNLDGSSFEKAILLESGISMPGRVNSGGQEIYYRFVAPSSRNYVFYTTGSSNTVGRIYSSSRSSLQVASTGGAGNNFRIIRNLTGGTTYYLKVNLSSSNSTGNYVVVIEPPQ